MQNVFWQFCPSYLGKHVPYSMRAEAARYIMGCRTAHIEANVQVCTDCGYISIHYNSYHNRGCFTASLPCASATISLLSAQDKNGNFFLPVKVASGVFHGKHMGN